MGKLDKPAAADKGSGKAPEPVVYTMPKDFRGASAGLTKKAPAVTPSVPAPAPKPLPKPVPPPPLKPVPQPALQKRRTKRAIFIVLGVLILLGGVIGYVVYTLPKPPAPASAPALVPTPAPPPAPAPAPTSPPPAPPKEPVAGLDTDSDGLTDVEERLFGTNVNAPDTDNDSFLDGNELFHLYNPGGLSPGRLAETPLTKLYSHPTLQYSLLAPTAWVAQEQPDQSVVWALSSGENFTMSVVPSAIAPEAAGSAFQTKGGYASAQTGNRLTTSIPQGANVYVFKYDLGPAPSIEYRQTYMMMLNSLQITNQ